MRFLLNIFIFFGSLNLLASDNIDSLVNLLESGIYENELSKEYEINYKLGEAYFSNENEEYEKASNQYFQAYQIAVQLSDNNKVATCFYKLGLCYQRMNDFQKALEYYNNILSYKDKEVEGEVIAGGYTQLSSIYQALGDYEKAYKNQMAALLIYDKEKILKGIANSHYNIGGIFFYQNNFEQALTHYKEAMQICNELKNDRFIYSCLAALGSVHEKLGNIDKSLNYNTNSLEIAEKLSYKTGIAYSKGNIGVNYFWQEKYFQAEEYMIDAIRLKTELGDRYGLIGTEIDLSILYLKWKKPSKAVPILNQALKIAKDVESKSRQSQIYQIFADIYDELGDDGKAYEYIKNYMALKDSLLSEKTLEEMGQTKKRFEVEQKEHQIEILQKENELLGKNKKIQKLQLYIFAISSLLFLMFLWWYRSRLKFQRTTNKLLEETNQKVQVQNLELQYAQNQLLKTNILLEDNNVLLEEKNELLNGKNEEIRIKNKQLECSNEDLKQFAYVASHDLKEPLRMIKSYTSLLKKRYDHLYDDSGKEFMYFVTDAVDRMQTLLDDLLDFSRAGTQPDPTEYISVKDTMFIVEANLKHRIATENGTLMVHHQNFPSIKAHRTQLMQLLQNLVSNGLKFKGDKNPEVIVDCQLRDKEYVFSIKDNGIGISKENLQKVFEMFKRLHTREEYEGTGIGLATCKRIVSTWGGDIWVESEVGEGSTFLFSVPVSAAKMETVHEPDAMMN